MSRLLASILGRGWISVLNLGIALLLTVAWFKLAPGRGGKGEFSFFTLETRTRSERTLFFGKTPIYRSEWKYHRDDMAEFLIDEGIVEPIEPIADRWEVLFHWNDAWRDGQGELYYRFVRGHGREWTLEDRERGRYCWRRIFKLARSPDKSQRALGIYATNWIGRVDSAAEFEERIGYDWKDIAPAKPLPPP